MPKTVTARFETEEQAERALAMVASEVPLRDSAVIGGGAAGGLILDTLSLSTEDRAACEQQLSKGGFLLVAQVATEGRGEAVLRLLNDAPSVAEAPEETEGFTIAPPPGQASAPPAGASAPAPEAAAPVAAQQAPAPAAHVTAEQTIPIVEEELRIGKREVVRAHARVHSHLAEEPVREEVELFHEETHVDSRPVNRRLSDEEVAQGGLLQERVIDIAEMREEAVISKEAFVREELVVTKSVHSRIEQIEETVRHTEVETERLEPEGAR